MAAIDAVDVRLEDLAIDMPTPTRFIGLCRHVQEELHQHDVEPFVRYALPDGVFDTEDQRLRLVSQQIETCHG
jgi:hypothetical protein